MRRSRSLTETPAQKVLLERSRNSGPSHLRSLIPGDEVTNPGYDLRPFNPNPNPNPEALTGRSARCWISGQLTPSTAAPVMLKGLGVGV